MKQQAFADAAVIFYILIALKLAVFYSLFYSVVVWIHKTAPDKTQVKKADYSDCVIDLKC